LTDNEKCKYEDEGECTNKKMEHDFSGCLNYTEPCNFFDNSYDFNDMREAFQTGQGFLIGKKGYSNNRFNAFMDADILLRNIGLIPVLDDILKVARYLLEEVKQ